MRGDRLILIIDFQGVKSARNGIGNRGWRTTFPCINTPLSCLGVIVLRFACRAAFRHASPPKRSTIMSLHVPSHDTSKYFQYPPVEQSRPSSDRCGRQAGKQASRQAGKQASRQAGKQASRQAGKQASRQAGNLFALEFSEFNQSSAAVRPCVRWATAKKNIVRPPFSRGCLSCPSYSAMVPRHCSTRCGSHQHPGWIIPSHEIGAEWVRLLDDQHSHSHHTPHATQHRTSCPASAKFLPISEISSHSISCSALMSSTGGSPFSSRFFARRGDAKGFRPSLSFRRYQSQ